MHRHRLVSGNIKSPLPFLVLDFLLYNKDLSFCCQIASFESMCELLSVLGEKRYLP